MSVFCLFINDAKPCWQQEEEPVPKCRFGDRFAGVGTKLKQQQVSALALNNQVGMR